jgi:chromosome segregation ATPase
VGRGPLARPERHVPRRRGAVRLAPRVPERQAELKSKVAALEQLYGRAVVSLQEANAENERLKREIRAYEEREAQFREQLHDAQAAIKSLQGRVKELENGSGSHRAEQ